jgi:hypothetical protein
VQYPQPLALVSQWYLWEGFEMSGMFIELEYDVVYDYQPPEAMVMYPNEDAYPGCDASIELGAVMRRCSKKVAGQVMREIIAQINSPKEYVDIDILELLTNTEREYIEMQCWDEMEIMHSLDEY